MDETIKCKQSKLEPGSIGVTEVLYERYMIVPPESAADFIASCQGWDQAAFDLGEEIRCDMTTDWLRVWLNAHKFSAIDYAMGHG